MLINTGRGALVDTKAVIEALKAGRLGHLGLDVYEEEAALFFEDRSWRILQDDVFARLLTFPNVIVTGHQGSSRRKPSRDRGDDPGGGDGVRAGTHPHHHHPDLSPRAQRQNTFTATRPLKPERLTPSILRTAS